ncbi:CRAL-TRIO domain and GOLD domain-containing protein [Strongyloides ratti]|uniref:CRAL-TRIO domain and GOLD domain-containing protein n=1 Tax=Strongyloides ratti TaxID=34506 RepID=A0A090KWF7_STRRB|nr:CRAL-TRIO domain and GOLD domain-containing protein [Strongyloides ratti]CEF61840.1 CRAL-TRIO domain and GOLD domain-containing protein [Strongyloides ratti]
MTKGVSTLFGESLSEESKKLIKEVRGKLTEKIHPNFDNDFNIYRFILSSERLHKKKDEIIKHAVETLNNHLRIRRSLSLDEMEDLPFEDNLLFKKQFMPQGMIVDGIDKNNRLMWYIEYATISVDTIAHGMRSSQSCILQFYQFEHMLKKVNKQEKKTGKLSSLRHVIDMNGYEINPFTMLFVSSGTLSYYSQLFHYENYPELVTPIEIVNIAKWIHVPYKLAKTMMPTGFSERFRLHDDKFIHHLKEEVDKKYIPLSLGGDNSNIKCIPSKKLQENEYWKPKYPKILTLLEPLYVGARKNKYICIHVETPKKLGWYFKTDGDVYFGIFYDSKNIVSDDDHEKIDTDKLEMVYPWLKISAKLVHEGGSINLEKPGKYYMTFGNKHSWLTKKYIDLSIQLNDEFSTKKHSIHGGKMEEVKDDENIFKILENGFE